MEDRVPSIDSELAEAALLLLDSRAQAEDANSEPVSEFTITRFTYDSFGSVISGQDQGSALYVSSGQAKRLSVAPYGPTLDWRIAHCMYYGFYLNIQCHQRDLVNSICFHVMLPRLIPWRMGI
jgi:hypothetical protein